jgi:putative redox protein
MQAKVVWQQKLSFTGMASSFEVPLGADPSVGGDDDGFRPMQLIALGIAGCTAMDVISILKKKRQDVTAFEVEISGDQAQEHPKVFTRIQIHYLISGNNVDEKAVERAIELSETKYCPAQAMFREILPIGLTYEIHQLNGKEADGDS